MNVPQHLGTAQIEHTLAVVPVRDIAVAQEWYATVLERAPDNNPMPTLIEWQTTETGWVQVTEDANRAGHGLLNLAVSDLRAATHALTSNGVRCGDIIDASKGVQLSSLRDPDGNLVTLIGNFRVRY